MRTFPIADHHSIAGAVRAASGQKPAALLASPDCHDVATLKPIFDRQQWKLYTAETLVSALRLVREESIPVIVSERDLPPYDWRLLFEQTRDLTHRPSIIVASSLADEYLWSEVLNLGGHDVLAKPFREAEVVHVLSHAWRQRHTATDGMKGVGWADLVGRSA